MANGQQSTTNNTKDTRAGKGKDSAAKAPANQQSNGSARAPAKPDSGAAKK
jgi:hypothetical protein